MNNKVVKKDIEVEIVEENVDWVKEANDLANNKIVRLATEVVIGFLKRKKQIKGDKNGESN